MVNKGQTTQWSTKDRQHNGQQRTDNTIVNKGQTTQWSTKDRQHNGQQRTKMICKELHRKSKIEQRHECYS